MKKNLAEAYRLKEEKGGSIGEILVQQNKFPKPSC